MRRVLFAFGLLLFVLSGYGQQKPNIILFIVDDLGYYDLSMTGSELYETPNIDALASEGTSFTNAYVSHPRCVPSRYAVQTGKFPARAQVPGGKGHPLKPAETTIGEVMKEAGYITYFAGKWHLGHDEKAWPQSQGYDVNIGGGSAGAPISYFYPYNTKSDPNDKSKHKKIYGLEKGKEGEYLTDRLTDETVEFILSDNKKPFFITLAHYGVHTPFQAKKEDKNYYKQKVGNIEFDVEEYIEKDGTTKLRQDNFTYAAMIKSVDESIASIVEALKKKGIYDNTVIIFTSDHGGLSNRGIDSKRRLATTNSPLRAGKGHVYEGGIKVPFIVYWKDKVAANNVLNQVTINTDIFPTILDIAGMPLRPQVHQDGLSMLPSLQGKEEFERTLFWHSPLGRPHSTGDENASAVRVGDYKLINYYDKEEIELYNLKDDPYEKKDISSLEPETVDNLNGLLLKWKKEINAIHK